MAKVDLGRYRRLVQMFWDPEPANDASTDQPVWCLGRPYQLSDKTRQESISSATLSTNPPETLPEPSSWSFSSLAYEEPTRDGGGWPQGFIDDFGSRFWMTYRSGFDSIPKSCDPGAISVLSLSMRLRSQLGDQVGFTSDSGWGCMIRSGQSLLANAMALLRLGRGMRTHPALRPVGRTQPPLTGRLPDWRRGELRQNERQLISLFSDDPRAPYSIHNFVNHGASACGKYPGEWFGPSATARCIQLVNSFARHGRGSD